MAKRKSDRQLEIEREYRRARRNLLAYIRAHEKELARTDLDVPEIPQRITEGSIRNIERYRERVEEMVHDFIFRARMGEIVYDRIMRMFGSPANIKQAEEYIQRTFDQALDIQEDMDYVYENLYNTKPEVVERAQQLLYDSNALKEEVSTQAWATMVKYGELPTKQEARHFGDMDDDLQNDSEEYEDDG